MKSKVFTVGALAFAMIATPPIVTVTAQNGVVVSLTRRHSDLSWTTRVREDPAGPGQSSPGDVGPLMFLQDHGYAGRVIVGVELNSSYMNAYLETDGNAAKYLVPTEDTNFTASLVYMSGSDNQKRMPNLRDIRVGVLCGEHGLLGPGTSDGQLFMFENLAGVLSVNDYPAVRYMKVIEPDHPIMQGIPLDSEGRVKIVRDPYPQENAHIAEGGFSNWNFKWNIPLVEDAAEGTTVIGVLDGDQWRACFSVADIGGLMADSSYTSNRLVHIPWQEGADPDPVNRSWQSTTTLAKVIFLRAAKWAMGETLTPYQSLGIVDAGPGGGDPQ